MQIICLLYKWARLFSKEVPAQGSQKGNQHWFLLPVIQFEVPFQLEWAVPEHLRLNSRLVNKAQAIEEKGL